MNYLAHSFLSGNHTDLLIGNFIADAVRGKQILTFREGIQQGIKLHREIDLFTDTHEIVQETKNRLRPDYGKYAPVIADMFYDHFLAANFNDYSTQPLSSFSARIYTVLKQHWEILPERVKYFLPHMMEHNWLLSYARVHGINQALTGLSRRTTFSSGMETAARELKQNYPAYAAEFNAFMPELIAFVKKWRELNGNPDLISGV